MAIIKSYKMQKVCICGLVFSTNNTDKYLCDNCEEKEKQNKNINQKKIIQPIDFEYDYGLFTINKNTINNFDLLENRRRVTRTHVRKIKKILLSRIHFESPIIVNLINNKLRLIDGNHRIEAIFQILKKNSDFEIKILLIQYKELSPEEEIQIFKRWNSGKPQSVDDLLQSIIHKMSFYSYIQSSFPVNVSIYSKKDCLQISLLCNALLAAKKNNQFGRGIMRDTFEEDLISLKRIDYDYAEKWLKFYSEIFGPPDWGNKHYNKVFFTAMAYICYTKNNWHNYSEILKIKIKNNQELFDLSKIGTRDSIFGIIKKIKLYIK